MEDKTVLDKSDFQNKNMLELKTIFAAEDWPRNIQKFSQNN